MTILPDLGGHPIPQALSSVLAERRRLEEHGLGVVACLEAVESAYWTLSDEAHVPASSPEVLKWNAIMVAAAALALAEEVEKTL